MVLPTLINSKASGTFVSKLPNLPHNTLNKPLKLQLFNGSPASTGIMQCHNSALTLDSNLRLQLQDVNPNIEWKDLTMQFSSPKASLAAAIPLSLQSALTADIPNLDSNNSRATQTPSKLKDD
ncbi:hypothetical protein J132_09918 [Termitomyces sp. J132]|nr:hypothetical protein C0989_011270 [Termitomyces sp. Mn162]KNZ78780.1 hypothetical protein J132_09918 [Termitomyces sp. J132]